MKREIKTTKDGSKTLYINDLNESYHSSHGAYQEAVHVFINNGFLNVNSCEINILEMGFGTGLNVLVTIDEFLKNHQNKIIRYHSLEKYPVTIPEIEALNYPELFENEKIREINQKIHNVAWNKELEILPNFFLSKFETDFFNLKELFLPKMHLVYYDCFGSRVQPDLWEESLFKMVADKMTLGGLLTTYASKGSVRRILQKLNFKVEKKQGPPGKREMINATLQDTLEYK